MKYLQSLVGMYMLVEYLRAAQSIKSQLQRPATAGFLFAQQNSLNTLHQPKALGKLIFLFAFFIYWHISLINNFQLILSAVSMSCHGRQQATLTALPLVCLLPQPSQSQSQSFVHVATVVSQRPHKNLFCQNAVAICRYSLAAYCNVICT